MFIKLHAVTEQVKDLVSKRHLRHLRRHPLSRSDQQGRADRHSLRNDCFKAMKQKPGDLIVQRKAQDEFQKVFGLSCKDALVQGSATSSMARPSHDKLKKDETMISLAVSTAERSRASSSSMASTRACASCSPNLSRPFTVTRSSGTRITQMGGFPRKVLGGTHPKTRSACLRQPFEALAERANWLGMPLKSNDFGRVMLATGVPLTTIKAWCDDPDVPYQDKAQSWFDLVEDLDSRRKSASINARFCTRLRGASLRPDGRVCQMCARMELCA